MKMDESDDDDIRLTAIQKVVLELVLSNQSSTYVDTLLSKLNQEEIKEPSLLKQLSREGIENSLKNNDNFTLGKVSDIIGVRDMIILEIKLMHVPH